MTPKEWTLADVREEIKKLSDSMPIPFDYTEAEQPDGSWVFQLQCCLKSGAFARPHSASIQFAWGKEPIYDCPVCAPSIATWKAFVDQAAAAETKKKRALMVWDACDYREASFPPREPVFVLKDKESTAVMELRSLIEIFSWRGTGKTMCGLGAAGALVNGTEFLNMKATRKFKVLYCEGELPDALFQERVKLLIKKSEPGYLRLITLDQQANGITSLATPEGQALLEGAIKDAEVVILDSISSLFRIVTNDEEQWQPVLDWFMRLRSQRGVALIILHHAGKGGLQRGHSKSDDPLDVIIKLTKGPGDEEVDHLQCKFEFDKFRGRAEGIRGLRISMRDGVWSYVVLQDEKYEALKLYLMEFPKAGIRQIARDLGPQLGVERETIRKMMLKLRPLMAMEGMKEGELAFN
jgi:hypothetical protein